MRLDVIRVLWLRHGTGSLRSPSLEGGSPQLEPFRPNCPNSSNSCCKVAFSARSRIISAVAPTASGYCANPWIPAAAACPGTLARRPIPMGGALESPCQLTGPATALQGHCRAVPKGTLVVYVPGGITPMPRPSGTLAS